MTRNELIAAVNKLSIPLKRVAQETSIPLSALNRFWANKKELGLMEFDGLVKWVVGKNNEPGRKEEIMKRRGGPIEPSYKIYDQLPDESLFEKVIQEQLDQTRDSRKEAFENLEIYGQNVTHEPTGINGVTMEECKSKVDELSSEIRFKATDKDAYDGEKFLDDNYGQIGLTFLSPKTWIKKIEAFCYENKITPEELIIGYVPPKVHPIPRPGKDR